MTITELQQKSLLRRLVARTRAGKEGRASRKWEWAGPHPGSEGKGLSVLLQDLPSLM